MDVNIFLNTLNGKLRISGLNMQTDLTDQTQNVQSDECLLSCWFCHTPVQMINDLRVAFPVLEVIPLVMLNSKEKFFTVHKNLNAEK